MKTTIEIKGPILTGSISTTRSRCGQQNCACKAKRPKLHGPYYRWTGIISGKRTTKTINPKIAQECKKRIQRYKKLKKKLDTILKQALQEAPWIVDIKKSKA